MRKSLLLIFASVIALHAFSQGNSKKAEYLKEYDSKVYTKSEQTPNQNQPEAGQVIWSENFSAGIPAGWVNQGSSPNALWEYRGVSTNPDTSVGTRGAYGLNRRIESPTWTNGFIIFDSDFLDNAGIAGNFGGGVAPTPHTGTLTTSTIDLSTYPNVDLKFHQYHRKFYSDTYVAFSRDNGTTWPDTLLYNDLVTVNNATDANDSLRSLVSSLIGGYSMVKLKFIFDGDYYFWQIDDIKLSVPPANDLQMSDVAIDQGTKELFYGQTPTSQVIATTFRALVYNGGFNAQPNTRANVNIDFNAGSVYNQTSAPQASLASDASIILDITSPYTPSSFGEYSGTFTALSDSVDEVPYNNTMNRSFWVTDTIYAVDSDFRTSALGTNSFTNATDGFRMATLYELTTADTVTSVTINITVSTRAGGLMEVTIYDTTGGSFTGGYPIIAMRSDFHTVTVADSVAGTITIPIPAVLNGNNQNRVLQPGGYYVSVEMYSNSGANTIRIWDDITVSQAFWASIIYIPNDRWYTNGNAFHIRPNFGVVKNTGIEDAAEFKYSVSPNPAKDVVMLNLNGQKASNYHVVITNIQGQVLQNKIFSNTSTINESLDVSTFSPGMYLVRISDGQDAVTKRFVVGK